MGENSQPQQQNNQNKVVEFERKEIFSGPIPHPAIIERYEKIYPGPQKRFLTNGKAKLNIVTV